jgi:hypothetical protein
LTGKAFRRLSEERELSLSVMFMIQVRQARIVAVANQIRRVVSSAAMTVLFTALAAMSVQAAPGGKGGGKPGGGGGEDPPPPPPPPPANTSCAGDFPGMAYTRPVYGKRGRVVGTKLLLANSKADCEVEVFENEVGISNLSFVYDGDGAIREGTLAWSQVRDDGENWRGGREVVKVAVFLTTFDGSETMISGLPLQSTRVFRGASESEAIHGLDLSGDRYISTTHRLTRGTTRR